jgi:hypothetical protein
MYETYKLYPRLYYSKRRDPAQSLELWGPLLDGVFSTFFFYDKAFYEQGLRGKTNLRARSSAPLGPPLGPHGRMRTIPGGILMKSRGYGPHAHAAGYGLRWLLGTRREEIADAVSTLMRAEIARRSCRCREAT